MCGATRPKTTLDFGHITKKVTKFHHPGCCAESHLFACTRSLEERTSPGSRGRSHNALAEHAKTCSLRSAHEQRWHSRSPSLAAATNVGFLLGPIEHPEPSDCDPILLPCSASRQSPSSAQESTGAPKIRTAPRRTEPQAAYAVRWKASPW